MSSYSFKRIGTMPTSLLALMVNFACTAPSLAGECVETSRMGTVASTSKPSAETTVKNEMSKETVRVDISRGDSVKFTKFLKPGEQGSYMAHVSKQGGAATMTVQIYPESSSIAKACTYVMRNTNDDELVWKLPDGADAVCPGRAKAAYSIACEKSFNNDHLRYKTKFTLTDAN
jgi:hypothetical protein